MAKTKKTKTKVDETKVDETKVDETNTGDSIEGELNEEIDGDSIEEVEEKEQPAVDLTEVLEAKKGIFESMVSEFQVDEESKEIYARAKNLINLSLENWATALAHIHFGVDVDIYSDVIAQAKESVDTLLETGKRKMQANLLERLRGILLGIVSRTVTKVLARAVKKSYIG